MICFTYWIQPAHMILWKKQWSTFLHWLCWCAWCWIWPDQRPQHLLRDSTIQCSVMTPLLMVMHNITVTDSKLGGKYVVIRNDCRSFNNCHLVLQMQPHVISFYGVTSRIRFMFLLSPQVSWNWRYEWEPPLKPSPLTCYKQFGTNSIIVLVWWCL